MPSSSRLATLSFATLALLQANIGLARQPARDLWPEDSPAHLSFGNPDDEDAPRSPATAEIVNPETEEHVAGAAMAFGDSDPESTDDSQGRGYFACRTSGVVHPTL